VPAGAPAGAGPFANVAAAGEGDGSNEYSVMWFTQSLAFELVEIPPAAVQRLLANDATSLRAIEQRTATRITLPQEGATALMVSGKQDAVRTAAEDLRNFALAMPSAAVAWEGTEASSPPAALSGAGPNFADIAPTAQADDFLRR
jgi:hypothetical protein